jgi:hypothetical protein
LTPSARDWLAMAIVGVAAGFLSHYVPFIGFGILVLAGAGCC